MNAAAEFIDGNILAGRGPHTAVVDAATGRELAYDAIHENVNRMGHALRRLGVRPEERVMILLPDCPEFIYAFFGTIKIGAVAVPVNTLLTPADYEYLLGDSRARVLIVHERLRERVAAFASGVGAPSRYVEHIVTVNEDFEMLLKYEPHRLVAEDMSPDAAAFWLYSSGTTGFPKGAVHLQHDMHCCAESFGRGILGITARDRTFSVAKLFFAYGLGNALYFPFSVGASTVLFADKPDARRVFEVVQRHRPSLFYAVPTAYSAMLAEMDAGTPFDFSSVRLCSSAGEPLAPSLYERWLARTGIEILDGIGSTEMLHTFIANRPGRVRVGSSGELVPGYDARIVDTEGRDVADGEVGDLLIKGESSCSCYWNKQEQTGRTIIGEWLRTGDKYIRDGDGYFWYQGRSDDMLKCGGYWVSPTEVESAIVTHPAVLECAVVGCEDENRLVKPMAFVVLRNGQVASSDLAAALKAHVKSRLAAYKYPRRIEFVPELPKTATGKIQRYKLRSALIEASSEPATPPTRT